MKKNNEIAGTVYYIASSIISKVIVFVTVPVFTRIMTQEDNGIVNTFVAIIAILQIIIGLSLEGSVVIAYRDYRNNIDDFIASILMFSLIWFSILFLGTLLVFKIYIPQIPLILIIFALIQSYGEFVFSVYMQKLIYSSSYKLFAFYNILKVTITSSISIILVLLVFKQNKYLGRVFSDSIVAFLVAGIIFAFILWKSENNISTKYWKPALKFSVPQILHSTSFYVMNQANKLMIPYYLSFTDAAIYGIIYSFGMIPQMIATSIANAWAPIYIELMEINDIYSINKKANMFCWIFTFLGVLLLLGSPEVIKIMIPENYWSGIPLLIPITLSAYCEFVYMLYVLQEKYYGKTVILSSISATCAILTIVLNYILLGRFGLLASAFIMLATKIVSMLLHYLSAQKCNSNLLKLKILRWPIAMIVLFGIISAILLDMALIRWILFIIISFVGLMFLWKTRKDFIKKN